MFFISGHHLLLFICSYLTYLFFMGISSSFYLHYCVFLKKSHVEYSCSSHGCDLRAHSSVSFVPWINLIFEFHSDEMFCKLFHVNLWINYYFWGTHRTKRIWRDSGFNVEPCVCVCVRLADVSGRCFGKSLVKCYAEGDRCTPCFIVTHQIVRPS